MQSSTSFLFVFLVLYLLSAFAHPGEGEDYLKVHKLPETSPYEDVLSFAYYYQKCPEAEAIINQKVKEWINKDYTLAASLIRLHFHDCSVRVRILHNCALLFHLHSYFLEQDYLNFTWVKNHNCSFKTKFCVFSKIFK